MTTPFRTTFSDKTVRRAVDIIQAARADGLHIDVKPGGNGVDLLLDNMGELENSDDARKLCLVLTRGGYVQE